MEIKLGDFGLATKLEYDGERKRTICGTPNYIAPEILEGKTGHSYEVDIWSLGVILYTFLIGKPPFETSDVKTTYKRIRMNAYSFPEHITISPQAKNLITRILTSDPAKRPTLDEIANHEFLNMGGTIPKLLPVSTLACPPSASYLKQFLPSTRERESSANRSSPQRFESTAPVVNNPNLNNNRVSLKEKKDFINTDRIITTPATNNQLSNVSSNPNLPTTINKLENLNTLKGSFNGDNYRGLTTRGGNDSRDAYNVLPIENLGTSRNNLEKTEKNLLMNSGTKPSKLPNLKSNIIRASNCQYQRLIYKYCRSQYLGKEMG